MNEGLVKLIYSGTVPSGVNFSMSLVEGNERLTKAASVFSDIVDGIKVAKDHTLIHVVALGESERYGFNRNGDGFPKRACVDYHHTFVRDGHVYRHHQNKDPNKKLGDIVKSAYNEPMGRIELLIQADNNLCADEMQKIATTGEIPVSMACKVKEDRCSICDNLRKSSSDPNQCDHVRYELGKVAEDGKVTGTYNDHPNFFDISFVYRPADRIAWSLKVASDGTMDSVKLAQEAGLWVPENLAITSEEPLNKLSILRKIASEERKYKNLASLSVSDMMRPERESWELRKAAAAPTFTDETIERLREFEPSEMLKACADSHVVLDPESFFKYALGRDLQGISSYKDDVMARINSGLFNWIEKEGRAAEVCNDGLYDVETDLYAAPTPSALKHLVCGELPQASFEPKTASHRAVAATINQTPADINPNTEITIKNYPEEVVNTLAMKYVSYKLAATSAVLKSSNKEDEHRQLALLAAQNLIKR